ncbi:MAG: acyloxyacyl hydrolase [Bacteroidota bacterium]
MVVGLFLLFTMSIKAQDSTANDHHHYLAISAGDYSCLDLWASTGFINIQYHAPWKLWILRPQAGITGSFSGSFMAYAGLIWPAKPFKWLVIQTGVAAGYYYCGKGIDLHLPLEFRLSLALLYRFRNDLQLGAEFVHISNANLGPPNPGTESIGLVFKFPVGRKKRIQ